MSVSLLFATLPLSVRLPWTRISWPICGFS